MGQFFQHSFNHLTSNVIMHPTGFTFSRDDQTPSKTAINFSCRNYETMICDSFNESFGIFAPMVRGDIADGFDIKGKFEFRSSNIKEFLPNSSCFTPSPILSHCLCKLFGACLIDL